MKKKNSKKSKPVFGMKVVPPKPAFPVIVNTLIEIEFCMPDGSPIRLYAN